MLTEISVRNLGVIEEATLLLGAGMTALTGETGAGKTLVVGAIDLITGGRADPAMVGPGAAEAEIEGRFVISPGREAVVDHVVDDQEEVVVRRVIPRQGRSRSYVNGRLATVAALGELGQQLVDMHGQHSHQSLLRASAQRAMLDRFAGIDISQLSALLSDLRRIEAALGDLGGDARARIREADLLRHQTAEIDSASIDGTDEDERLDRAESVLAGAMEHRAAAVEATALVSADGPVADGLGQALAALGEREPFVELAGRLADVAAEVSDIASMLRVRAETIEEDPAALAALRERRHLLAELRRKYGATLAEVLQYRAEARHRLDELESHESRVESLEQQRADITAKLTAERARIRHQRAAAAPELSAAVESHLADLAMTGARMTVSTKGEAGEQVTFLLAANPGHDAVPLARAASGGELARTMLALRLVLTQGPATLVFDEVDAGIGGTVALAVGRSLASLGGSHQVLVVTHLPQVAAYADHHVMVEKSAGPSAAASTSESGSRAARARSLTDTDRIVEISRMLSGSPRSASAQSHAEELLNAARAERLAE